MTGAHVQDSERMKLKLSLHSQFWMIKKRMSQDISYTDCLLVAWHHMQSTYLIQWCKSVIIKLLLLLAKFLVGISAQKFPWFDTSTYFDVWKLPLSGVNSKSHTPWSAQYHKWLSSPGNNLELISYSIVLACGTKLFIIQSNMHAQCIRDKPKSYYKGQSKMQKLYGHQKFNQWRHVRHYFHLWQLATSLCCKCLH